MGFTLPHINQMETRTVTQVKVWMIYLNPMTGHTQERDLVAWSDDKEILLKWYEDQKTEPYTEEGPPSFDIHGLTHKWNKVFKKGGPLEWYNGMPPTQTN